MNPICPTHMNQSIEIIDFNRPDGSRKNLFITNLPGTLSEADIVFELHKIFNEFGLIHGVNVYPSLLRNWKETESTDKDCKQTNYYAFVTFYSAVAATTAKDKLNSVILVGDNECKITFAKRKKEVQEKQILYITRCFDLIHYYLGFNSWSSVIKTIFEDEDNRSVTDHTTTLRYVCMAELTVQDLTTDGVGVWQETYTNKDPLSKMQAVAKCKKVCHYKALENAFSKVLLVVLGSGKVYMEIDTTKPDFNSGVHIPQDQLVKVNDLTDQPDSEEVEEKASNDQEANSNIDDLTLHILQDLEDDM